MPRHRNRVRVALRSFGGRPEELQELIEEEAQHVAEELQELEARRRLDFLLVVKGGESGGGEVDFMYVYVYIYIYIYYIVFFRFEGRGGGEGVGGDGFLVLVVFHGFLLLSFFVLSLVCSVFVVVLCCLGLCV